jgi:hypothetical protein
VAICAILHNRQRSLWRITLATAKIFARTDRVLCYLGPEIVRTLLADSQSNALTPSRLLRLSKDLPHDWKEQRRFLGFAA